MIELGRQFGLYVIKETISANENYVYCKADDPFFNREVALKVYSADLFSDEESLAQVEDLLEGLAVLDHPSIAPIYDSGVEGGYYYYTTACYYGGSLADQQNEPMPIEQLLCLLTELAQALNYATEQNLACGKLDATKIFFSSDGHAVISGLGIDIGIRKILYSEDQEGETAHNSSTFSEAMRSLGELALRLALGPVADFSNRIDEQIASVENAQLRKLLGRFLSSGEVRFASFAELLEELTTFDQLVGLLAQQDESVCVSDVGDIPEGQAEVTLEEQAEQAVVEIRRLLAEKNNLQSSLDKAIYERNVADNKFSERVQELTAAQEAVAKAQDEANVAWELVAGQKYDRWRPVAWAVGGFAIGFLLSGSYGYYYSEQTRSELLAKLQANEELIKTAAWRSTEVTSLANVEEPAQQTLAVAAETKQGLQGSAAESLHETPSVAEVVKPQAIIVDPVKDVAQQWWPAGNEFSVSAAIPIDQIKSALGFKSADPKLSDGLRQEVLAVVSGWADSWSNQDLRQYFSFYSDNYKPEMGHSQDQWRNLRTTRLTKPDFIELNIDDISVRQVGEDRIQVKLKQSYRSDLYQDRILKSINLIKENGTWRILMERSLGMVNDIVGG